MVQNVASTSLSFKDAAAWLKTAVARLQARREMGRLSQSDLERIAADLGVSPSELWINAAKNRDWQRLLDERMRQAGLDKAAVEKNYPRVVRDLERTCGRCESASRCQNDFNRSGFEAVSGYCPNTHTLDALRNEARNDTKR